MAIEDELLAIRLELKGAREAITGLKDTDKATEGVGKSTRKAGDEAQKAEKKTLGLGSAYGKLKDHAKLALGFLGVGGIFALEAAIENTEELAKTTSGLSRNFDLQTNVASRWGAVAYARGIDSKSLGMSFTTLSKQMTTAAREGGKSLLPFHQLGISQEEAAKGAHNFQWGIMRVAKALGEEEGGAKRAAAAKALLGKGSSTLLPLFSEGAEGLKKNLDLADEYGVTLSGKTKDGVMDMVESQRELKLAQLGVEVSMTRAFKPAIEAGEDQVKEFIKTLNDPDLSAEEKINKIEEQFEGFEDDLITVIEQALPGVAEHAGQLGVKLASAVWHGFENSGPQGRLAIVGYIGYVLLGDEIKVAAKKAGGKIGTEFGVGLVTGATGAFIAFELWKTLSRETQDEVVEWAVHAGEDFVNFFIKIINRGIREIDATLNENNPLGNLPFGASVAAPQIGEVGEVEFLGEGHAWRTQHEPKPSFNPGEVHGTFIPGGPEVKRGGHKKSGRRNTMLDVPRLPDLSASGLGAFGGNRPIVIEHQTILDGKVVAESTTHHAEKEAARR